MRLLLVIVTMLYWYFTLAVNIDTVHCPTWGPYLLNLKFTMCTYMITLFLDAIVTDFDCCHIELRACVCLIAHPGKYYGGPG